MLAILSDIHADMGELRRAVNRAYDEGAKAVIQVGDFGFYASVLEQLRSPKMRFPIPVFALDGNHEDHSLLNLEAHKPVPLIQNEQVYYVPRGVVIELDGRKIGCLGGAGSIDKAWRVKEMADFRFWGKSVPPLWSEAEQITLEQEHYALGEFEFHQPDFLVTHTPPQEVITECFDNAPGGLVMRENFFGVPPEWFDPSAHAVNRVWQAMNRPPLYCGHMHRPIRYENVRVLEVNELVFV
jgi:predicted phosphodiesterase